MGGYNWFMLKTTLKKFNVRTSWPEPMSSAMKFDVSNGRYAILYKSNNIEPETVEWVVAQLGINMPDFEQAYQTQQT